MHPNASIAEATQAPQDRRKRQVHAEQIRLLYTNAYAGVGVTVCVAIILSYLQWGVISHPIVLAWLMYMLVISSARFTLARRYSGIMAADTNTSTTIWGNAFIIGTGLSALGWGAAGVLLYPEAHLANQVILAFVLGGMMLGAGSILASRPEAFLAFIIPVGLPVSVRFLLQGDDRHLAMGLLATIFTVAILITTWHIYLTVRSSLNLQFENKDLVVDLQSAKSHAETLNQELEVRVRERTVELRKTNERLQTEIEQRKQVEEALQRAQAQLEVRVQQRTAALARSNRLLESEVCERTRAEHALRESEERFRNLADTAPVMIWVSGPDKLFTFFNKTWLNFTGRTLEQELGNGWAEGVHRDDLVQCYERFSSSFDAHQHFDIEHRLRRADGEYRWVLCSGLPRFEPGGAFAGYVGSCIDITDQKCSEATLRRSLDEIAHLNRVAAMGELTASMAHELNQPLAAILSNAQAAGRFISGETPDLTQVRECLNDIAADGKRAGEVIRRLRTLLQKGESQVSLVDLNEVVSDAIRLVRNDALLRNTSVVFQPFPGLARVLGDRIQLYQVALNLVMNSLDAAAERPAGERWVSVRTAESETSGVQLTVEDSGKGIAESDLARVFEPFFSTKQEGLGMGLSISRSIVEAHGGRIWLRTALGVARSSSACCPWHNRSRPRPGYKNRRARAVRNPAVPQFMQVRRSVRKRRCSKRVCN